MDDKPAIVEGLIQIAIELDERLTAIRAIARAFDRLGGECADAAQTTDAEAASLSAVIALLRLPNVAAKRVRHAGEAAEIVSKRLSRLAGRLACTEAADLAREAREVGTFVRAIGMAADRLEGVRCA